VERADDLAEDSIKTILSACAAGDFVSGKMQIRVHDVLRVEESKVARKISAKSAFEPDAMLEELQAILRTSKTRISGSRRSLFR